ncbi:hypothetical protein BB559_000763 [Furculomyces boomerangus]|uniref:Uncharacterized protein n=2 Tax=Harpellales TaxID=61421 RepID=A0A2T9Z475_9FUNG|nr:hypothetical protein BB559_000763 [Furculomyces boomerangus]PVZ98756.1 hypothetical protein BB558_005240 [Smittium angustum]PWA03252.1 hypothetical protein BB558_000572 [Smittium angustum]
MDPNNNSAAAYLCAHLALVSLSKLKHSPSDTKTKSFSTLHKSVLVNNFYNTLVTSPQLIALKENYESHQNSQNTSSISSKTEFYISTDSCELPSNNSIVPEYNSINSSNDCSSMEFSHSENSFYTPENIDHRNTNPNMSYYTDEELLSLEQDWFDSCIDFANSETIEDY